MTWDKPYEGIGGGLLLQINSPDIASNRGVTPVRK